MAELVSLWPLLGLSPQRLCWLVAAGLAVSLPMMEASSLLVPALQTREGLDVILTGDMWHAHHLDKLARSSGAPDGLLRRAGYSSNGGALWHSLLCQEAMPDPRDAGRTVLTLEAQSCSNWDAGEQPL